MLVSSHPPTASCSGPPLQLSVWLSATSILPLVRLAHLRICVVVHGRFLIFRFLSNVVVVRFWLAFLFGCAGYLLTIYGLGVVCLSFRRCGVVALVHVFYFVRRCGLVALIHVFLFVRRCGLVALVPVFYVQQQFNPIKPVGCSKPTKLIYFSYRHPRSIMPMHCFNRHLMLY